jgi:pentatricopeptide repeat protein
MVQRNVKPSISSYNAAINACSVGMQPQQAVDLLREMLQQGLKPTVISYNSAIDACSGSGQWQQALKLLREVEQRGLKPDITTYNRVINACQNAGNWQLAVELLLELNAAGLEPDKVTFNCVIDALHAAKQYEKAEEMYLEMLERGLRLSHWSTRDKGKLDFHDFTEGMAAAAMRIALRAIAYSVGQTTTATAHDDSSSSASYVHPIGNDLHIITGHGTGDGKQGSVLQPLVLNMLRQLNIECCINARNKGMVTVKSDALQKYAARLALSQH